MNTQYYQPPPYTENEEIKTPFKTGLGQAIDVTVAGAFSQHNPIKIKLETIQKPEAHRSQRLDCPHCQFPVNTEVSHESGALTHIAALVLTLTGCCFGCCLLPYCIDNCKDSHHECPNCGHYLGVVKRLS